MVGGFFFYVYTILICGINNFRRVQQFIFKIMSFTRVVLNYSYIFLLCDLRICLVFLFVFRCLWKQIMTTSQSKHIVVYLSTPSVPLVINRVRPSVHNRGIRITAKFNWFELSKFIFKNILKVLLVTQKNKINISKNCFHY